ncbi:MAG: mechanosensitive ion channel [Halobacteriales archaeon]|nr:mechanosensitive ion channel [Halobacteriales archaeon]
MSKILAQAANETIVSDIRTADLTVALVILVGGLVLGYASRRLLKRLCRSLGVDEFVEGTTFERVADSFGTSTVGIVATTVEWAVYLSAVFIAVDMLGYDVFDQTILLRITNYVPNIVAAFFILVFGAILGDKAAVLVSERLEGIRISDVTVLPIIVRYSIIFVAFLMALSQLGVSTLALHILLSAYLLAVIAVGVVSLRIVLPSVVSGFYILATHQYGIGDRVCIGEVEGVVQEIDLFTTRVDDGEREHVVPNSEIFEEGVSKKM